MKTRKLTALLLLPALLCLAGADWQDFKSADFKVRFPGAPKEITSDAGGIKTTIVSHEGSDGAFVVSRSEMPFTGELPPEAVETTLDGSVKGVLGSQKGAKLVGEPKKIKLNDKYPGREVLMTFEAGGKQGFLRSKIVLVGKHLYQVMSIGSEDFVKSKDSDMFFSSFALTK